MSCTIFCFILIISKLQNKRLKKTCNRRNDFGETRSILGVLLTYQWTTIDNAGNTRNDDNHAADNLRELIYIYILLL